MNRYSTQRIVVGDARTAAIRVSGVFNAGDTPAFTEALGKVYHLRMRQSDDQLILSADPAAR